MSEIVIYQTDNQNKKNQVVRQSGIFKYSLKAHQSAKINIPFAKPYNCLPFINISLNVISGEPTENICVIGAVKGDSFNVHMSALCDSVCCVSWNATTTQNSLAL